MKESNVQKQIVGWFKLTQKGGLIYATQNETIYTSLNSVLSVLRRYGVRSNVIAIINGLLFKIFGNFKNMGLLAGASDLNVILPSGQMVFVEVKYDKNKQSENQKQFQQRVESLGYEYWLVYSLDEFILKINNKNNN